MSFNLASRINNLQAQQNDIINNVTEIKNNITNITVVNNVLAENKQETLLHDNNIVGVPVIDANNNIRQVFGVYPIECNLYFNPFNDIKNNHIQLTFDSNSIYASMNLVRWLSRIISPTHV